jgi:hypothetical protein
MYIPIGVIFLIAFLAYSSRSATKEENDYVEGIFSMLFWVAVGLVFIASALIAAFLIYGLAFSEYEEGRVYLIRFLVGVAVFVSYVSGKAILKKINRR